MLENEDLLEEVQRLRMEVEYLKKLNALVQKREKSESKIK
jgi:transposase